MNSKKSIIQNIFKNQQAVQEALNKENKSTSSKDETFWTSPWDDKKKTGNAIIAFLPFPELFDAENKEYSPYIFAPLHNNMIGKKGKKYYNILCPTGKRSGDIACPFCEKFFEFYNKDEQGKKLARNLSLGRKKNFYSNILVLKNDSNPDEVGKVFKWKYGTQIQEKINDKISPSDDSEAIMIHNVYDILPFKVKVIMKDDNRNFQNSEWGYPGKSIAEYIIPNASNEEKEAYIDDILSKLYNIKDFVTDDMYKSYSDLEVLLNDVLAEHDVAVVDSDEPKQKESAKLFSEAAFNKASSEKEEQIPETPTKETKSEPKKEVKKVDDDFDDIENLFNN